MTDIKKLFGVKETSITKFVNPERQSMEQTEDYAVKKVINTKEGTVEKVPVNDNDIVNKAYADSLGGAPEGTAVKSTGEAGGTKFLREDGDGTSSWQSIPDVYLRNDAADAGVGLTLSGDNSSTDTAYVPMVLYNTDATPPAANTVPIGTIYIQYTP